MMIKIKVFAASMNVILKNERWVQVMEGSTIVDLLTFIETRYPDIRQKIYTQPGVISSLVNIFVNGKKV